MNHATGDLALAANASTGKKSGTGYFSRNPSEQPACPLLIAQNTDMSISGQIQRFSGQLELMMGSPNDLQILLNFFNRFDSLWKPAGQTSGI